jgi:hypothetical protein
MSLELFDLSILTTPEVAKLLGITPGRVHQLAARMDRLPVKRGAVRLWTGADVRALQKVRKPNGGQRKVKP